MSSPSATPTEILGRPSVLWHAEDLSRVGVECLSAMLVNGQFRVWIVRRGVELTGRSFDSPADGIRWATEMERDVLAQGWSKLL